MLIIQKKSRILISAIAAICTMSLSLSVMAQATVDQVTDEGEARTDAGAADQQRVDAVSDQTGALLAQFKTVTKVVDGLKIYNSLLQRQIDNQNTEMAALSESIDNVALIQRQITPMMTRMLDSMEDFIVLDTPFLLDERNKRLATMRGMMERSDVTPAEKFRKVIEGYQIENDYGRTIEAYGGSVNIDGNEQEVDFLRIGRVSLSYQSIGGNHTGAWDPVSRTFVSLPAKTYKAHVAQGLRVAKKQVAPDLLIVPITAASGETL
jgi:hypothetical protein